MPDWLTTAARQSEAQLRRWSPRRRAGLADAAAAWLRADAQANQLIYYQPLHAEAARVHASVAREIGVQGGNKSGKTGLLLAEAAIQMTGVVPESLQGRYPAAKLRPPIRVRLVVTSLVSAWDINLKLKLQWWEWNGAVNAAGLRGDPDTGHWGWIPRRWLLGGDWERAWSEKHRVLRLNRRGDYGLEAGSTLQVMSHDQDLGDFNQGSFHLVIHDEIPPEEIYRANRFRTLEVGGRLLTGGTPPDEETRAVAAGWFFDQVLTPGLEGSAPAETFAVVLDTEANRTLAPAAVEAVGKGLTPEQRRARFRGETLHLAGLVLPGFTVTPKWWCVACAAAVRREGTACAACGRTDLVAYTHQVDAAEWASLRDAADWPVVFYGDPHPSRPTAGLWVKVDPLDRWWVVGEMEVAGDAQTVKTAIEAIEAAPATLDPALADERPWTPVWRKLDPKITSQSNQFAPTFEGRPFTLREAFQEVGFDFLDANTNFTVARDRLVRAFPPDPYTRTPRLRVAQWCPKTCYQVTHFTWNPALRAAQAPKEQASRRHSDFPACLRYLAMDDPTHRELQRVAQPIPVHLGAGGVGRNPRTGW